MSANIIIIYFFRDPPDPLALLDSPVVLELR